jgi:uncharacterized protein YecT (DUF1311 family)
VPVRANAQSGDPCEKKTSNMEMRECYARAGARVNAETDTLAKRIADEFGREAQNPVNAPVVADLLRKAASSVMQSQKTWKDYRDQHCSAVEYSWTTGSGAGTAYEACLFELGQARLRELRSAFEEAASH